MADASPQDQSSEAGGGVQGRGPQALLLSPGARNRRHEIHRTHWHLCTLPASLPSLFEETQMRQIWVQHTPPQTNRLSPFSLPRSHTLCLARFPFVCLSLTACPSASLSSCAFILPLIPCSVAQEADPRGLHGRGVPGWFQLVGGTGRDCREGGEEGQGFLPHCLSPGQHCSQRLCFSVAVAYTQVSGPPRC